MITPAPNQASASSLQRSELRRLAVGRDIDGSAVTDDRLVLNDLVSGFDFTGQLAAIETPVDQVHITQQSLMIMAGRVYSGFAPVISDALAQPLEIWLTQFNDFPRQIYIASVRRVRRSWLYIRQNRDTSIFWQVTNSERKANEWRRGQLLWGASNG
ncbi:MAG: hypothetical protein MI750_09240 [Xanthomonadales bacterium]|nr:hypothetical protein [Xanthomonadales bacterium]